uniref:Rnf216_1 protein n=3 Tax=Fopius arisanus TaxID=64838 RepID=A0A0C9QJK2_9HYME
MDEGGKENSVDSSEAFDTYPQELSEIDELDDKYYELSSNSSSSRQEYTREFSLDVEYDSSSTDDSTPQVGEILEENNNDPNNNMEGGEGNVAEEFRPIVEVSVSPQPGCSKDFNTTEKTDRVSADVHKTAVRIQTFLHDTTYPQIVSILEERPNFELEIHKLFGKSGAEVAIKRNHDDQNACEIETKRLTLQKSEGGAGVEVDEALHSPGPEAFLDGVPESDKHELTPPEPHDRRNRVNILRNDTPIRIDSSDDEERGSRRTALTSTWASSYNSTTNCSHPMNWRDCQKLREGIESIEERVMNVRPPVKVRAAPATIVREEQVTKVSTWLNQGMPRVNNEARGVPAATGSSRSVQAKATSGRGSPNLEIGEPYERDRGRRRHSPPLAGHVNLEGVPTKIKIVTNGSGTRVIQVCDRPRHPGLPPYDGRYHFPQFAMDPQPGSSTGNYGYRLNSANAVPLPETERSAFRRRVDPKEQLQRELIDANRQIAERIDYCRRADAERKRVGGRVHTVPQVSATVPPRPERNIPPLPHVPAPEPPHQQRVETPPRIIPVIKVDESPESFPRENKDEYCIEIYTKLRAMFPNIKKGYIKRITPVDWAPNVGHDVQFAQIVERLLANETSWELEIPSDEGNDPRGSAGIRRTVDETYEHLLEIFPNADPTFLRDRAEKTYKDDEALESFIEQNLQTHSYPTREQYLSKMRITEEQLRYTTNFTVPTFLEKFPDPFKHFLDKKRTCKHEIVGLEFLKSQFNRIRVSTVSKVYSETQWNMSIATAKLRQIGSDMNSTRKFTEIPTEDINLLQEMAFIRHQSHIQKYIDDMKKAEKAEFEKLKKSNELLECQCCYDNECMPSKCSMCDQGHVFCNSCIIKGTDTKLGEGDTHVPCFQDCGAEFSLATLQEILKPTKFSILVKKRQAAEVAAAGLEGLVSCPFCHFASIPPEGDKVFKCLNSECMKESCIQCKEPNHVPLRCNEVGKADKARKYIEEKMTEALARKCYNCKKAYFKEEGCNKITCPCGAIMCYLCDKKIRDYSHFRGQGSDDMTKCPLYSDSARLNAETVRRVANEAKRELLRQDPSLSIETDHLLPAVPPPSVGPHQQIIQAPHVHQIAEPVLPAHPIHQHF